MHCVSIVRYIILVGGVLVGPFVQTCMLRQGTHCTHICLLLYVLRGCLSCLVKCRRGAPYMGCKDCALGYSLFVCANYSILFFMTIVSEVGSIKGCLGSYENA